MKSKALLRIVEHAVVFSLLLSNGCKEPVGGDTKRSGADRCESVQNVLEKAGVVGNVPSREERIATCRFENDPRSLRSEGWTQFYTCLDAAKSDEAVRECAKRGETRLQLLILRRIAAAADETYKRTGSFPQGVGTQKGSNCFKAYEPDWSNGVWKELGLNTIDALHFTVRYESTSADDFTATSVKDRDCNGDTVTYSVHGHGQGGTTTMRFQNPPEGVY